MSQSRQDGLATYQERDRNGAKPRRSGIDYLGRYGGNARVRSELRTFGQRIGIVIDRDNYRLVREYMDDEVDLIPERDNKSEWSPISILRPLSRFGDSIPSALVSAICGLEEGGEPCTTCKRSRHPAGSKRKGKAVKGIYPGANGGISPSANPGPRRPVPSGQVCAARRAAISYGRSGQNREDVANSFSPEVYGRAVSAVLRATGGKSRRRAPYTAAEVLESVVHPESYAGAPYFCRNDEVPRDRILNDCSLIAAGERVFHPFLAGRRVQHGETAPKGRLVWMASLATTVLSSRFSKPCYEGLVGRKSFAFGATYREVGAGIVAMQSRRRFVYGLDFSAFDASLSARLIDDAFGILKTHLSMSDDDGQLLDRIISDFIHSRIVLPDGSMWQVHRGVPSGSSFTSLVDSVCNLIILQYIWIRLTGHELAEDDLRVLGDDSVVASDWYLSLEEIRGAALELGIALSMDKSERVGLGQWVPFLGHYWKCGRPRRDVLDITKRLAFPERWNRFLEDKRYSLLRRYSMTADSVEGYELFFRLKPKTAADVEIDVLNEIYRLDMPSLMPLLSEREIARAAPGRHEFRGRVEQSITYEFKPWANLRLIHTGRD